MVDIPMSARSPARSGFNDPAGRSGPVQRLSRRVILQWHPEAMLDEILRLREENRP